MELALACPAGLDTKEVLWWDLTDRVAVVDAPHTRSGKPDIAWDDPDAKGALVSDALALLAAVDPAALGSKAADAYALLALVAGQDVEPADGSDSTDGRWRMRPESSPGSGDLNRGPRRPPCS